MMRRFSLWVIVSFAGIPHEASAASGAAHGMRNGLPLSSSGWPFPFHALAFRLFCPPFVFALCSLCSPGIGLAV